jgi:hypothetical protein
VYPQDLNANFDVFSKGSSELQNKDIRMNGFIKAWQFTIDEIKATQQSSTNLKELKKEVFANLGISEPDKFINDPDKAAENPGIPPEAEWIILKQMAQGLAPYQPILIQPGEDYRKHYEEHIAKTATEEFTNMPDQIKFVWSTHIASYDKVLKILDEQTFDKAKEEKIEAKEVAIPS